MMMAVVLAVNEQCQRRLRLVHSAVLVVVFLLNPHPS